MFDDAISWGELAELTHATQVERFGWCICEDTDGEGQMGEGCPMPTPEKTINDIKREQEESNEIL
jgi:hypothetical protein